MRFQQLVWDGAHRTPDRAALHWVERDRTLTYAEAAAAIDRVAGALHELGVRRGDRVGVFAHNGLDYLLAMFGTWRLGAISALVNVQYADDLDQLVADVSPRVLVYTGDHFATVDARRAAMPSVERYICFDGPQPGAESRDVLLAADLAPPPDPTTDDDVAHLSFTSGTSGRPKGACLSHEPTARATRCIAERLRLRPGDVSLGSTALSSSYQLVANVLPPLHVGGTVCVMSRWVDGPGWEAAERLGAAVVAANPTVLRGLLAESRARGRAPGALRAVLSGGGAVPAALKRSWLDELGLPLCESYGQSELGGFVGLAAPDDPEPAARWASCGRPLPDKEVRVVDDAGAEVPVGVVGELVIRGGYMWGYWGLPERTATTLRDGWLHTGDVGYLDAAGYVFLRGRLSERLAVAGEHHHPRDVEEILLGHPAVAEAALVGLPDAELGQRPVAYVTLADGAGGDGAGGDGGVDGATLVAHVLAAGGRVPPGLDVVVLDALPMTPTGKVSKAKLLVLAGGPT